MKRNILRFPYLLSPAVLIAAILISAITGWSTENTVWGFMVFALVCLPALIVSIYNVRICKQQDLGLRFLFYVMIFVLSIWMLFSILFSVYALKTGLISWV